jgi:phosphoglycolate phosphatase
MRGIVFDLDGTLIDSAADLHAAVNQVMDARGLGAISLEQARSFIGHGAPSFVEQTMRAVGLPRDMALHEDLLGSFLHLYESAYRLTTVYAGVPDMLAALASDGWAIGLCTNKPERPAMAVLRHFGLGGWFQVLVGGDSQPEKKPHPAPLRRAIADLGATSALYVGDSEVDSATAIAAGVPFLLFTNGYRKSPVDRIPSSAAFESHDEVPGLARALTAPCPTDG